MPIVTHRDGCRVFRRRLRTRPSSRAGLSGVPRSAQWTVRLPPRPPPSNRGVMLLSQESTSVVLEAGSGGGQVEGVGHGAGSQLTHRGVSGVAGPFTSPGSLPAPEWGAARLDDPWGCNGDDPTFCTPPQAPGGGLPCHPVAPGFLESGEQLPRASVSGAGFLPSAPGPASRCPGTWRLCLPLHRGLRTGPCRLLVLKSGAWLAHKNSINICRNTEHFADFPHAPATPSSAAFALPAGRTGSRRGERGTCLARRLEPRMQD